MGERAGNGAVAGDLPRVGGQPEDRGEVETTAATCRRRTSTRDVQSGDPAGSRERGVVTGSSAVVEVECVLRGEHGVDHESTRSASRPVPPGRRRAGRPAGSARRVPRAHMSPSTSTGTASHHEPMLSGCPIRSMRRSARAFSARPAAPVGSTATTAAFATDAAGLPRGRTARSSGAAPGPAPPAASGSGQVTGPRPPGRRPAARTPPHGAARPQRLRAAEPGNASATSVRSAAVPGARRSAAPDLVAGVHPGQPDPPSLVASAHRGQRTLVARRPPSPALAPRPAIRSISGRPRPALHRRTARRLVSASASCTAPTSDSLTLQRPLQQRRAPPELHRLDGRRCHASNLDRGLDKTP